MTAKIYTDDKGRLVFQGFTCDNCVITGGDMLTNHLFGEFLTFADMNPFRIPHVVVIDCHFFGDNWISRVMTRISGGQVVNHLKSSSSDSPSEIPPATS